jgi:TolA-binding protein
VSQASAPKKIQAASEQPAPAAFEGEASKESTQQASALAQGIAASQRGEYGQAEKLLVPVAKGATGAERAQANLWLARSYRAQGDCARALGYYRTLTQAVSVGRDVLEEAADCYARVGNEQQASKLRARVQQPAQKRQ